MFLRMGFVVAHAGILEGSLVVLVSLALTVLTATSLSAIATNGEVEGGGAYFLISRSLGAESGGAIGLVFAVANAISVSMYLIGFSETVVGLYGPGVPIVTNGTETIIDNYLFNRAWDIRFVAFLGLIVILLVACAGADWVVKIDIGQLCILVIGILAFVVGSFTTVASFDPNTGMAFTGWNATTFVTNWGSDYRPTVNNPNGENFMTIFSVFFPAVTGMMAGANISGELKNAQKSLPFGTMLACILSNIVYVAIAWILGSTCLRDGGAFGGLFGDSILMIRVSVWGPLVIVGIFASTISSALATLVGAPRILKAVCDDGLFPPLEWFAVSRKSDNEPIRGYFLTALVAIAGIMIGDLNAIAPLITNFFLATRALINFACFLASYSRSPGWRPSYKMYNKWVSLVTAVLCIAVMFAISWWQALITLGIGVALYVYIRRAAPEVNWGAAELGYKWSTAKKSLLHLDKVELSHHVKTWRPIFLGVPLDYSRDIQSIVNYSHQLEHANGFTIVGDILIGDFHGMYKKSQERVRARRTGGMTLRQKKKKEKQKSIIASATLAAAAKKAIKKEEVVQVVVMNEKVNENETKGIQDTKEDKKKVRFGGDASEKVSENLDVAPSMVKRRATAVDVFSSGEEKEEKEEKEIEMIENVQDPENLDDDDIEADSKIRVSRLDSMAIIAEGVDTEDGVLTETLIAPSRVEGVRTMIQMCGVGRMKPNMLLLSTRPSLRDDWDGNGFNGRDEEYTDDMADMLLSALRYDYGVGLLSSGGPNWGSDFITPKKKNMMGCFGMRNRYGDKAKLNASTAVTAEAPTIDVYWVSDTGGCLLLIAYMHSQWARWTTPCQLRIFVHANRKDAVSTTVKLVNMMSQFRIKVSTVEAIDMFDEPSSDSLAQFPDVFEGDSEPTPSLKSDWNRRRTKQHLNIGEAIRKNSSKSTFVYVTLPMPQLSKVDSIGWQHWIDAITGDGGEGPNVLTRTEYIQRPPIFMVRGNQRNVLTYFA